MGEEGKEEEETTTTNKDLLSLEECSVLFLMWFLASSHSYRQYGFNNQFKNVFKSFEDCSDIIENPVPDDNEVNLEGIVTISIWYRNDE